MSIVRAMIDPTVLESLLRGIAIGGFVTAGAALALTSEKVSARWIGVAFFLCAIGHVVDNDAALRGTNAHAGLVSWIPSALAPALFWAFTVALFTDNPKFPLWRIGPAAIALLLSVAVALTPPIAAHVFSISYVAVSAILVAHAFVVIWRGWRDDLVERRRGLRAPVLAAGAAYVLIVATGDFGHVVGLPFQTTPLVQACALALLAIAAALILLRVDEVLLGSRVARRLPLVQIYPEVDASDGPMLGRLNRALDDEEVWRRDDLTIGALATHLLAPEHHLRRLINGRLGYRNFAALLNERRISAAKVELAGSTHKPVSSIAFELGYGSLGPFNRAFKAATGKTPTEWRLSPNSNIPPQN